MAPNIPEIPEERRAEIDEACRDFLAFRDAAERFDEAKKILSELKDWARNLGGKPRGAATCGSHLLTFSFSRQTSHNLPPDVATQVDDLKRPHKRTERYGRFTVGVVAGDP